MKKQNRNTILNTVNRNTSLALRRETIRSLTGEDLPLVVGGSSTILTERPTTTTGQIAC